MFKERSHFRNRYIYIFIHRKCQLMALILTVVIRVLSHTQA